MKILLIILLLCIFTTTNAQISPQNWQIEPIYAVNQTSTMNWFWQIDSTNVPIGDITTSVYKNNDSLLLITTVKIENSLPWTDTTVAELPNLKPIYHSSFNAQRNMAIHYINGINAWYFDKQSQEKSTFEDGRSILFFDSNIYPFVLRFLDYNSIQTDSLLIFDYNPKLYSGVAQVYIEKVEKEILRKGKFIGEKVFKVVVTDQLSLRKIKSIYFIQSDTRQLLRQEIHINGRVMIMEKA